MQSLSSRLVQARKNAKLTRDEVVQLASQTSGFSRSSLQDWEQEGGTREPKLEYLFDLAKIYGVHPWTLMSGEDLAGNTTAENGKGFAVIPVTDMVTNKDDLSFAVAEWWLAERNLTASHLAGYRYKGDTMSPTIADNTVVLVDKDDTQLVDGGVYVMLINKALCIRRVQRLPEGVRLINDNPKYPFTEITQEKLSENGYFELLGKVIVECADFKAV